MKHALTPLLIALCLIVFSFCKNKQSDASDLHSNQRKESGSEQRASKGQAKMNIPILTKDFGEVIRGDTLEHSFLVSNKGSDTLTILELLPSCPCVTAEITNKQIAPNDSAHLRVSYHTAAKMGYDEKELVVTGNGFPLKLTIRLSAVIHAKNHK